MPLLETRDGRVRVGQIWKYVGESQRSYGEKYKVIEILPAVKKPNWDWYQGIRYVPLEEVEGAPNDYTRLDVDFLGCFRHVG